MEHIFLKFAPENIQYTPLRLSIKKHYPQRNRHTHAEKLSQDLEQLWIEVEKEKLKRLAVQYPVKDGTYIEFIGEPGFVLNIKSLENKNVGTKLLNVRVHKLNEDKELMKATVFIPKGKEQFFLSRVQQYQNELTPTGNPRHQELIETISSIKRAVLESFWIGDLIYLPKDEPIWCEVWLRDDTENVDVESHLRTHLSELNIESRKDSIRFPEIVVVLAKASYSDLVELLSRSEYIVEVRKATEVNAFFLELEHEEQIKWAEDLLHRLEMNDSDVVVSLIDSGLNNGNIILNKVVKDTDIHSLFDDEGHDRIDHGTRMAGLVLFGNLKDSLESSGEVSITHQIESMKILPDGKENGPELYGYITANAVSNLYIEDENPKKQRIFCMAISTENNSIIDGRPSSWSASIDDIAFGSVDGIQKLFFVSAGNIRSPQKLIDYPEINKIESIEDPGQSWNAISVGAYTELDTPEKPNYSPVASKGQLSPFSRTSMLFEKRWPIKPEIVLEGGNAARDSIGAYEDVNMSLLSTHFDPTTAVFSHINATSAATALASRMAAKIQYEYPEAWPETIRALLIHSAEWTDEMKEQFLKGNKKSDYRELLRTCGYGVPSLKRAIETVNNRVTLIIQSELQPFDKIDGSIKTKDMHLHELPWPKEVLREMFDEEVRLKVTLSYFVEPGPGEKGWRDKYRYASATLRFDLNGSNSKEDFVKRINQAAGEDDYESIESNINWLLGPDNRIVGSIHSDTWIGDAVDLAESNYIGIYPVIGWWRTRPHLEKWGKKIRYSLVVSLSTPTTDVDLLTPIKQEIDTRIPTSIETEIEF